MFNFFFLINQKINFDFYTPCECSLAPSQPSDAFGGSGRGDGGDIDLISRENVDDCYEIKLQVGGS